MNKPKKLADQDVVATNLVTCWIAQLKDAGCSYDEMIEIFRLAKIKADILIAKAQL